MEGVDTVGSLDLGMDQENALSREGTTSRSPFRTSGKKVERTIGGGGGERGTRLQCERMQRITHQRAFKDGRGKDMAGEWKRRGVNPHSLFRSLGNQALGSYPGCTSSFSLTRNRPQTKERKVLREGEEGTLFSLSILL